MNRADRVGNELHALLAEIIRREIKDPRVGMVSITQVKVSGDLGVAEVFYMPLGGAGDTREMGRGLRAASGYLRRLLGKRMRLRHIPELRFIADTHHDSAVDLITRLNALGEARRAELAEEE